MKIELKNVWAFVLQATDAEHEWLAEYLSWSDEGAHFRRRYGYTGDGRIRLYNRIDDRYPAGFTRTVAEAARKQGYTVDVSDARVPPCAPIASPAQQTAGHRPTGIPSLRLGLRQYQIEAVQAAIKRTRGIVWAATGSGKTEIAMGLIESIPIRWLFLVNQTQLAQQASARYHKFTGTLPGMIAEGSWMPDLTPAGLTIATFQTLYAMIKHGAADPRGITAMQFLSQIQGIIVDECHVLPAESFRSVLEWTTDAYYRIGLSATPLARGDRKSMHLIGALGGVIYRVSAKTLIDAKVLAKPTIRFKACKQESDKKTWQGAYNELVVKSKPRNQLVCQLADLAAKPCIVFFKDIDQGKRLLKMLTKAGHAVEYVDGSTPTPQRVVMVQRLERGDTDILVASVVMQQGIDVPELRAVVAGAGGSSTIAALQRVGRGMRKTPGKDTFEVWDINDVGNKWTERHTAERVRSYEIEDYEIEWIDG